MQRDELLLLSFYNKKPLVFDRRLFISQLLVHVVRIILENQVSRRYIFLDFRNPVGRIKKMVVNIIVINS